MTTALVHRWTWRKETMLRDCWGRMPVSEIARLMSPHTEVALQVRAKVMGLPGAADQLNVYTSTRLKQVMGLGCEKTVQSLWNRRQRPLPHITIYRGDIPTPATQWRQLTAWLRNPLNWFGLDLEKITDKRLVELVAGVQASWDDAWLTAGEAADLLCYTGANIWKLRKLGRLRGYRHGNWWYLRSELLRFRDSN